MIHPLSLIFAVLLFAGCTTTTPSVIGYTVTSDGTLTHSLSKSTNTALTLKLSGTKSPPSLSSKALFYLTDHQEVGAYLYSRWNDAPGTMIDRLIAESIQDNGLFSAVIPTTSAVHSDFLLESSLASFYHRIHQDNRSDAYVDITYVLIDQKNKKTVASKRFVIIVPSASADAKGGVTALNRASNELAVQCTAWLYTSMKENGWTK